MSTESSTSSDTRAPVVILVEPQMGENIGMAARAMANFALPEMRLVAPRDGWPNPAATATAAGATHLLESATVFPDTRAAIADLTLVYATTARERGQMKRVLGPKEAVAEARPAIAGGGRVGILFGREREGLWNDEIALADAILTYPVDPAFPSLNLAQAVLLLGYEWFSQSQEGALPFAEVERVPASREMVVSFFDFLEAELDARGFYPPEKRTTMTRNMRDMFLRRGLSEQEVRTFRGVASTLMRSPRKLAGDEPAA
ncbi:RNA methyltransferase [Salinarimonas ramus]|uniref:tRNA (Cytidine/uridine-2'-O-)-methyltransferase TrmJ n=1 Tax=Salinarimonas ramus TaxID=690164 RepID=A0A917V211_9HYPH|nr:RNA methyltransferase [Salinarimonas ramus]GGK24157.1 tRNA (cytidine/uridine-2'-O-)-methyltransferase TrmJ [Salinarimonas ramus]